MRALYRFALFYFLGGIAGILLYGLFVDIDAARFIAVNWLAVGISVALITWGMPRRASSDAAGVAYLFGLGWLVLLLVTGIVLIFTDGIGVEELRWLWSPD